jgi:hypothetical protein
VEGLLVRKRIVYGRRPGREGGRGGGFESGERRYVKL